MFIREKKIYKEMKEIVTDHNCDFKSLVPREFYLNYSLDEQKKLNQLEEKVFYHIGKIGEHKILLLETLSIAKDILKHDGTFGKWCQYVGFKNREAVSIELKRLQIKKITNLSFEDIIKIPIRNVKFLTKKDNNFCENEIKKLILEKNLKTFLIKSDYEQLNFLEKKICELEKKIVFYKKQKNNLIDKITKTL
ncbi:hypothetical protein [Cetobacterium ceti]